MKINKRLNYGFTLIELLVVIVIIGILTVIISYSYAGVTDRAAVTSLQSDLNNASDQLRVDQTNSATGDFPTTVAGLKLSPGNTYPIYQYNNSSTPKTFCLTSTNTSRNQSYNINQEGVPSAGPCPIFSIDAGTATSYPGTGTTAYDLSGNNKNATLVNGVGYDSANGGSWTFDGVNETIRLGTGNTVFPMANFSMELWFKSDGITATTGTAPALLGITYGVRLSVKSNYLSYGLDNGTAFSYVSTPSTYSFYDSSWHHVVIEASPTKRQIFVDGELSATLNDTWAGNTRWPTNTANIGNDNNNTMYFFRGNIASFNIYNVNLSASDVNSHFNASRGLYGL